MPDPIDQTQLPATPTAPVMPNPQEMVDAALSGDNKVVTSPELPPLQPVAAPEPIAPPTPPIVAMGEETPLAFASMQSPTPNIPTTNSTPNTTEMPIEPATQTLTPSTEAPLPPPAVPQAPEPKKKGKLGKILAGVAVFLLALVGGIWGYINLTGNYAMIAPVYPSNYCGTRGCPSGTSCQNNQCVANTPPAGGGGGETGCDPGAHKTTTQNCTTSAGCAGGQSVSWTCTSSGTWAHTSGAYLGVCTPKAGQCATTCAPNTTWDSAKQKCVSNEENAVVPIGGSCSGGAACASGAGVCYEGKCVALQTCASTDQGGAGCPESCKGINTSGWTEVKEPGGGSYCNAQGQQCSKYRIELKNSSDTHCYVRSGEQCGGSCGGGGSAPPSATPGTPTMKCDGLTSVPATTPAPTIGTKLTFTCAGTVTPSTAGTLSYKFRYSINEGAPVAITPLTATPNKAELTINACGTYKVQCQACATLSGVLTCAPTWTGATQ